MERGWIKLWRKTTDSQVWSHSLEMRSLWLTLLMRANHAEGWFKGSKLLPGQLAASFGTLAEDAYLTVAQVRYHLALLEEWQKVARKVASQYQVVTICNWATYQCDDMKSSKESSNQVATKSQPSSNQVATNKKNKNDENENKNKKGGSPSGPQLTDEQFFDDLKQLYTWVDIVQERAKMQGWLMTSAAKGRKLTRKFAVNWLNRIDKPMESTAIKIPVPPSAQPVKKYTMVCR